MILGLAYSFFKIQNALTRGGIRADPDEELAGVDLPEMGTLAYPDFAMASDLGVGAPTSIATTAGAEPVEVRIEP